jgi:hypothetical protein
MEFVAAVACNSYDLPTKGLPKATATESVVAFEGAKQSPIFRTFFLRGLWDLSGSDLFGKSWIFAWQFGAAVRIIRGSPGSVSDRDGE